MGFTKQKQNKIFFVVPPKIESRLTSTTLTKMASTQLEGQNYQYYFVENDDQGRKFSEWAVLFGRGHIFIEDYSRRTRISLKYPHGKYEKQGVIEGKNTVCRGAEIRTKYATLSVYVHEYTDQRQPGGTIDLVANDATTSIEVPYNLVLNIMKFMAGSIDVDGVIMAN